MCLQFLTLIIPNFLFLAHVIATYILGKKLNEFSRNSEKVLHTAYILKKRSCNLYDFHYYSNLF